MHELEIKETDEDSMNEILTETRNKLHVLVKWFDWVELEIKQQQ
jgi:hypothetical protein